MKSNWRECVPENDDFEIFEAHEKNRSEIGLLLTTNRQLEIGTPILVRLRHFTGKDAKDEFKDGIHAQVVRCDTMFSLEKRPFYKAAIEYFELVHS